MPREDSKTCTKCGEEKPLSEFPRNGRGGWRGDCKTCHAAAVRRHHHANATDVRRRNRERMKRAYDADPEKFKARSASFRARHPERHLAWSLAWAEANAAKVRRYKRAWDNANPEARRDGVRKRRALLAGAFVAEVAFEEILLRDLGVCGICSQPITGAGIELDHIIPLAAGGTHEPNNVQLAHPTCNRRKWAKLNFSLAAETTL